jgi:ribosomal-protein-alanine N-acetyltransferase
MIPPIISASTFYLGPIHLDHVNSVYVSWLKDPQVNKFLEVRHLTVTVNSQKVFVSDCNDSTNTYLFGIFNNGVLIGTSKLGPINFVSLTSDLGIMIGDSSFWGKGIASESIGLIVNWAKQNLKLRKVTAGAYATNIGSIKSFLANNFVREGLLVNQVLSNEIFDDVVLLGKVLK